MSQADNNSQTIARLAEMLAPSRRILFITGAGMSADSGLPTYRGIGGLYNHEETEDGVSIEEALSGQMLQTRPELTWKYLAEIGRAAMSASFNRGHEVIAEMEEHFEHVCVLTQNIDGFHRLAGSKNVIDIHGDMHTLYCTACGFSQSVSRFDNIQIPPRCPQCPELLRPEVVLFGESLDTHKIEQLFSELDEGFDFVFTIGTTSVFPYIAQPVHLARQLGWTSVEINPAQSQVSEVVDHRLQTSAAAALDEIWQRYNQRIERDNWS